MLYYYDIPIYSLLGKIINSKVFRLRNQLKDYLESEEVYL